ncbi:MAG: DUF333 domain-containing protein [Anaerolineae bacterium]|nr:DUF333 domain-containing protein [Anaerolineae bacterium]
MNQERLDQIIALAIGIVGLVGCSTPDSSLPFCTKHAGRYESRQSSPGIFRGYCVFPDNTECEVRAFYEGRCQPGQIRSTDSSRKSCICSSSSPN